MLILKIVGIIVIVLVCLFLLTLPIYFFNLDMKFAASLLPMLNWWHDKAKVRRDKKAEKNTK